MKLPKIKLPKIKLPKLAEVRKLVAVVLGFAAEGVAAGVLTGNAQHIAQGVLAVATIAGVYVAPNAQAAGKTSLSTTAATIRAHLLVKAKDLPPLSDAELAKLKEALLPSNGAITDTGAPTAVAAPAVPTVPPVAP